MWSIEIYPRSVTPEVWRRANIHLHDDQFPGQVLRGTELFSETQREATLRGLTAIWTEVFQFWFQSTETDVN